MSLKKSTYLKIEPEWTSVVSTHNKQFSKESVLNI